MRVVTCDGSHGLVDLLVLELVGPPWYERGPSPTSRRHEWWRTNSAAERRLDLLQEVAGAVGQGNTTVVGDAFGRDLASRLVDFLAAPHRAPRHAEAVAAHQLLVGLSVPAVHSEAAAPVEAVARHVGWALGELERRASAGTERAAEIELMLVVLCGNLSNHATGRRALLEAAAAPWLLAGYCTHDLLAERALDVLRAVAHEADGADDGGGGSDVEMADVGAEPVAGASFGKTLARIVLAVAAPPACRLNAARGLLTVSRRNPRMLRGLGEPLGRALAKALQKPALRAACDAPELAAARAATERLLGALSRLWVRLQPTDDAGAGVAAAVEAGAFGVPPPRAKANADPWLD